MIGIIIYINIMQRSKEIGVMKAVGYQNCDVKGIFIYEAIWVSGRRYQRISLVAGLTNGELIAPMTYEEMMTSDFFEAWFQKFFLPTLTTPSVIIMDNVRFHRMGKNVRFHRMGKLELLCEEFGHKLLPLPPYSPEYNPIEKTWAHIKKHLKKVLPSCNTFYEALLSCSCFN
ncbi:transposase [Streptococcus pneumoniae]|nr:transposase [Streptococcus pneumoniae]